MDDHEVYRCLPDQCTADTSAYLPSPPTPIGPETHHGLGPDGGDISEARWPTLVQLTRVPAHQTTRSPSGSRTKHPNARERSRGISHNIGKPGGGGGGGGGKGETFPHPSHSNPQAMCDAASRPLGRVATLVLPLSSPQVRKSSAGTSHSTVASVERSRRGLAEREACVSLPQQVPRAGPDVERPVTPLVYMGKALGIVDTVARRATPLQVNAYGSGPKGPVFRGRLEYDSHYPAWLGTVMVPEWTWRPRKQGWVRLRIAYFKSRTGGDAPSA
ncbi:hypothetical protein CSAL01_04011 [Colletotrichum salicis]|uniref:Uncharacterized protein n=1 Tax=Colletotrichum salicis TaxID=1209931 RepID=A0A135UVG3_9PEZI|nr:hypothetical protein CSAL01_04011 [Colletotrichum salicis]